MLGPIDYVVLGFKGNKFDGSILAELGKDTKKGIIRVIDLIFVVKDADGNIAGGEIADQPEELKAMWKELSDEEGMQLITEQDLEKVGDKMENDSAAGILVIEHVWAKGLKQAVLDAGGVVLDEGRIHPEAIMAAVRELETVEA